MSANKVSKRPSYEIPILIRDIENEAGTVYADQFVANTFDKSKFKGFREIVFRGSLSQSAAGTFQTYCQLYNVTTSSVVASSEITADLAQFARSIQTTGNIAANLSAGAANYWLQMKVESGGTAVVEGASIIVRY